MLKTIWEVWSFFSGLAMIGAVFFILAFLTDELVATIKKKIDSKKRTAKCTCSNCWYWRHEEKFGEPITGFCTEFDKYTCNDAFCSFGKVKLK